MAGIDRRATAAGLLGVLSVATALGGCRVGLEGGEGASLRVGVHAPPAVVIHGKEGGEGGEGRPSVIIVR